MRPSAWPGAQHWTNAAVAVWLVDYDSLLCIFQVSSAGPVERNTHLNKKQISFLFYVKDCELLNFWDKRAALACLTSTTVFRPRKRINHHGELKGFNPKPKLPPSSLEKEQRSCASDGFDMCCFVACFAPSGPFSSRVSDNHKSIYTVYIKNNRMNAI